MASFKLDSNISFKEALEAASSALQSVSGTVVLAPTETVYGLLCAWDDAKARDRIYTLKRRSDSKPLAAFIPSIDALPSSLPEPPKAAIRIANAFCPGPMTIVIPGSDGSTFGFRIPDHPFMLALLKKLGTPLASTSANLSGSPSALSVEDALKSLDGLPSIIVDGGRLPSDSIASTVVSISPDGSWRILREGPISGEMISSALR